MIFYFMLYFVFADTSLLSKLLIIFGLNGILLHALHKKYLQDKKPSRKLDIITNSNIYFIHLGVGEFLKNCLSHFEVGIWTFVQR